MNCVSCDQKMIETSKWSKYCENCSIIFHISTSCFIMENDSILGKFLYDKNTFIRLLKLKAFL